MPGRSLLLWILVPFLGFSALALWLTRPAPPEAPDRVREEPGPGLNAPQPSRAGERPASPPPRAMAPVASPAGTAPESPSPPPRGPGERPAPPATSVLPPPAGSPEAGLPPEAAAPSVDKEDVRRAIQAAVPLIRQCFEDVAGNYPGPHTVKLKFTIEGQGLTGHFRDGEVVDSTLQDPFALACFLDALLDVRFPPPRGGGRVTITYPFHFQPGGDAGR